MFAAVVLDRDLFERYIGTIPPLAVVIAAAVVGGASMRVLTARGWVRTGGATPAAAVRAFVLGMSMALPAIAFDSAIHFPEDLNVAWPQSLLFYPAVAFVAEVAFHITPLAVLVAALGWRFDGDDGDRRRIAISIAVVALVETAFHTLDALGGDDRRLAAFVAPQLVAVGVAQLVLFRRHGLTALVGFRLGYYLVWHVVWGHLRLDLLF